MHLYHRTDADSALDYVKQIEVNIAQSKNLTTLTNDVLKVSADCNVTVTTVINEVTANFFYLTKLIAHSVKYMTLSYIILTVVSI